MQNKSESAENVLYPQIASELEEMVRIDQDVRQKEINDPEYWGGDIDKEHTEKLKGIIERIGWPTVSKVGKEASFSAWLLVQHADHDVIFQEHCLDLMKQEPENEVSRHDVAYLEDRVRVNTGRPQLYGTQFKPAKENRGKFVPQEIENAEQVEERRREMGLQSIAENTDEMYQKYNVPKPEN